MSISPYDRAFIALEIAEAEVIRLYGISIFQSKAPDWKWPLLEEKRPTCSAVQAYFEALEVYEILQKEDLNN